MKINWRLIALYGTLLALLTLTVACDDVLIRLFTGMASIVLAFLAGAFAMIQTGGLRQ
ncbi:hypothetical protein [Arcanobacterium haemolyticum]